MCNSCLLEVAVPSCLKLLQAAPELRIGIFRLCGFTMFSKYQINCNQFHPLQGLRDSKSDRVGHQQGTDGD